MGNFRHFDCVDCPHETQQDPLSFRVRIFGACRGILSKLESPKSQQENKCADEDSSFPHGGGFSLYIGSIGQGIHTYSILDRPGPD
jgi:hypothetical protein